MKKLKLIIIILAAALFTLNLYSQDITQTTFLSELDNKETATYGDALDIFKLQSGGAALDKNITNSDNETYSLKSYDSSVPLTKGMASLMSAKYLNLDGSFMYLIFGTERYAYKACVSNELFNSNGSENDMMTGPELIELLARISDIKGVK